MNSGNLETSPRLQKTYRLLLDGKWHSSAEIHATTGSMAAHSDIAGVRDNIKENGDTVEQRYNGTTLDGNKISEYRLTKLKKEAPYVDPELRALYDGTRKNLSTYINSPEVREAVQGRIFLEDLVKRHPELINI